MKSVLFSLLSFIFFPISSYSIESEITIEIQIIDNKSSTSKSMSKGDYLLEFNNYNLFDVISKITEIPIEYFHIEGNGNAINPLIIFKATSKEKITKKAVLNAFREVLKNKLGLNLFVLKQKKVVNVIYSKEHNKLKKCKENLIESSILKINRTLKAKCIYTEQLISQINDWYDLNLVNDLDKEGKYNFEIHHANSLEEFLEELNFYYSIRIIKEEREVNTLSLKFKN